MVTEIILSFIGLSCLASTLVFAACVASARADRIQRGAFEQFAPGAPTANEQKSVANPQLSLSTNSV